MLPFGATSFEVEAAAAAYLDLPPQSNFDGFGLFLNGTNVAFVASHPVNITHPAMDDLAGTELDGVLAPGGTPLLTFGGAVNPTGNTLRFIIGDREDSILDSTVYVSGLEATVPEPGATALALVSIGALAVRSRARTRRRDRTSEAFAR